MNYIHSSQKSTQIFISVLQNVMNPKHIILCLSLIIKDLFGLIAMVYHCIVKNAA